VAEAEAEVEVEKARRVGGVTPVTPTFAAFSSTWVEAAAANRLAFVEVMAEAVKVAAPHSMLQS
jgi:hypothetical protein